MAEADLRDRITDPDLRDVVDDMPEHHGLDVPDPEYINRDVESAAPAEDQGGARPSRGDA